MSDWTVAVHAEVVRLATKPGIEFTLTDLYRAAEGRLARAHPNNDHVQEKIRQQLQILRDEGTIEFLGAGRYRRLK